MEVKATHPILGRVLDAVAKLDTSSKLAIVCIAFGWFFIDTLVVSVGSLQHGVRFFYVSAVIADPTRVFYHIDAPIQAGLFGVICVACLFAPLLPHFRKNRLAWLSYLAPLILIVLCGALLYSRTSREFFTAAGDAHSLGGGLIRFANDLVRQGSGLVSKHVSIGAGGYLAFIGSLVLSAQGLRSFNRG